MYEDNKILCVIPARGGSKGLPGKNIKSLLGKPLIAYTIEQAQRSKYIDKVIVSTDDRKIAGISLRCGAEVPFIRPDRLALDKTGTIDVLLHAMDWMESKENFVFDILVLLHATTPLRLPKDIDCCIETLFKEKADNVFSVSEAHRNPYFNMVELDKRKRAKLVKKGNFAARQSAPRVFDMNASIYVWRKNILKRRKSSFLRNTSIYIMPKERSVDIDDQFDFLIAQTLLNKNRKNYDSLRK